MVKNQKMSTQLDIAKEIAKKLNIQLKIVEDIIGEEQKLTMNLVKAGQKVVKKNYMTLYPTTTTTKPRTITSPLDKKTYNVPSCTVVRVKVGEGFKSFINGTKMPQKMCRYVQTKLNTSTTEKKEKQ